MCTIIGTKITTLREEKGITLEELAKQANLSISQLSIIENNHIAPSLSVLTKISGALEVGVNMLLDGTEDEPLAISRTNKHSKGVSFSRSEGKDASNLTFFSLAGNKSDRNMEPFMIEVTKGNTNLISSSHEGEEFLYVIEGEIELHYGDTVERLSKGDSVYYDSVVPHSIVSIEDKSSVVGVIYVPCK